MPVGVLGKRGQRFPVCDLRGLICLLQIKGKDIWNILNVKCANQANGASKECINIQSNDGETFSDINIHCIPLAAIWYCDAADDLISLKLMQIECNCLANCDDSSFFVQDSVSIYKYINIYLRHTHTLTHIALWSFCLGLASVSQITASTNLKYKRRNYGKLYRTINRGDILDIYIYMQKDKYERRMCRVMHMIKIGTV